MDTRPSQPDETRRPSDSAPIDLSERVAVTPEAFARSLGRVFAVFDASTQDSGNISYGVEIETESGTGSCRIFVKTAGRPDDPEPYLDHAGRSALLRNAAALAAGCDHPALPTFHGLVETPEGPLLVYDWVEAELLYAGSKRTGDSTASPSAHARFKALPLPQIIAALDQLIDLHVQLESMGWIASDLYDGSLIYDFDRRALHVVDLDSYHRGPFVNSMGRMFGSSRFMAPEEFRKGATIDSRTTVFTLGRALAVFLGDGSLDTEAFRGSPAQLAVLRRACAPAPADRFATVRGLAEAWQRAGVPTRA